MTHFFFLCYIDIKNPSFNNLLFFSLLTLLYFFRYFVRYSNTFCQKILDQKNQNLNISWNIYFDSQVLEVENGEMLDKTF